MQTLRVELGDRSYEIRIGDDLAACLPPAPSAGTQVLVVCDARVSRLYGRRCEEALRRRGFVPCLAEVPAGESSKDLRYARHLYDCAIRAGLDRKSFLAALGGGMVGDLAGFVAATYLRGIRYLQVPTTLLAMVDSSVGGKTGINLPQGKNLVGAFHQPWAVAADLTTLRTLSRREYLSGLAEVVKYGVIQDAALFRRLERNVDRLLRRDLRFLAGIVARCCEIKAEVVTLDERESGLRAILNFGHTFGHALENATGYGTLLHGEAVSVGMAYAAAVSEAVAGFPAGESRRVGNLLRRLGLPVKARIGKRHLRWADFVRAMSTDKKVSGGVPRFVLAQRIGAVVAGCEAPASTLEKAFESVQAG